MTLGPELVDLSDDAGNLRPEIARVIADVPDRPVAPAPAPAPVAPVAEHPWRAAAPPQAGRVRPVVPAPGVVFPQRPARQLTVTIPDLAAIRVSLVSMLVVATLAASAAGLIGASVGSKGNSQLGVPNLGSVGSTTAATPLNPSSSTAVLVNGVNVNMRTGPGLGFPVSARLMSGEGLAVHEAREGWCSVTTAAGASGWVYAALVRGRNEPGERPAVVQQLFVSGDIGARVILRPGQKVLHLTSTDGSSIALLPDGSRIRVPVEVLVDAD